MFSALRKLLPSGEAWTIPSGSGIAKVLEGLSGAFDRAKAFADLAYLDMFPDSTRELEEWKAEFGCYPHSDCPEELMRAYLANRSAERRGQSPSEMRAAFVAAGFDAYVHECWASRSPFTARDPRSYTTAPRIGQFRCAAAGDGDARCGAPGVRCNRFLANVTSYWDTLRWSGEAPAPIPSDSDYWPFFIYIGGETFGTSFSIHSERWREFQWLVEQIKPARHWVVFNVTFTDGRIFDDTFALEFE
jgi:hypothetical protein